MGSCCSLFPLYSYENVNINQNTFCFQGGGRQYSGSGPQSKQEMQVTMTGKERREYEEWKREREKIDQERIARHQQHGGGGGNWSREWDKEKQE